MAPAYDGWRYLKSDNAKLNPTRYENKEIYGIFRGWGLVTAAEDDDDTALFFNRPISLGGRVETKIRHLLPGAFF